MPKAVHTGKSHEEVHAEIFSRINGLESKVDETNGYLRGVVESNEKVVKANERLIELIERRDKTQARIMWGLLTILLLAIGIIGYGAIGKEGMFSVRQTVPFSTAALPAQNDLDK